jgi:hypothetical protein
VRPGMTANEKSSEITDILKELSNAPTSADKHAIIERLLLREQRELLAASSTRPESEVSQSEDAPAPAWRMSSKSTEMMNGLKTEHFSRQWETEAIIRSIFEQAQQGHGPEHIAGLATPFKPTAHDMAKAIESLGYSARALYHDDPPPFMTDIDQQSNGSAFRLVLMASGVVMVALVLLMI